MNLDGVRSNRTGAASVNTKKGCIYHMRRLYVLIAAVLLGTLMVISTATALLPNRSPAEISGTSAVGTSLVDAQATYDNPNIDKNAFRFDTNGAKSHAFQVETNDDVNEVVVRSRNSSTATSSVTIKVRVDGVLQTTKTIGTTSAGRAYQQRSWLTNIPSGQHNVEVIAGSVDGNGRLLYDWIELRGTTVTPPTNTWEWNASTPDVVVQPGDSLVSKVNNAPANSVIKVHSDADGEYTYNVSSELQPASGVKLRAQPGTFERVGGKAYDVDPAVHINVTHSGDNGMKASPGLEVRGFELSGVNPPFEDTGSGSCAGKGSFIAGGPGNGTELYEFNRIHDNAAVGISNVRGQVLRNTAYNNTTNIEFLGCNAGAFKGSEEFEAGWNYVHNEDGNGIWCDNGCENQPLRGTNGMWFHDNVTLMNGSAGMRIEETPDIGDTNNPQAITAIVEDNISGGNSRLTGRADIHVHDSSDVIVRNNSVGANQTVTNGVALSYGKNQNGIRASDSCRTDRPDLGDPTYGPVVITGNDLNGSDIRVNEFRRNQNDVTLSSNTEVGSVILEGSGSGCG